MELVIAPETVNIIEESVKSGRFTSAGEMIDAAIQSLSAPENFGDFAPGEMQRLIEQGQPGGNRSD